MKTRTKRILGVFGIVLGSYFVAYFLSVSTTYLQIKAVYLAVPVYRP
jgi:hypothetical protein